MRVARIMLLALLTACASETPQPSPDAAALDTGVAGGTDAPIAPGDQRASTDPQGETRPGTPPDTRPNARLITPDGWGPLRIGMSRAEVVAAAGEDANPDAVGGPDPERCDEFRPRDAPAGVLVMIEQGVLTRITVSRNRDIATPAGFRVGDAGAAVAAEYGARATIEPHQYVAAPARYITVWQSGSAERRGIRYETGADDTIIHLRAGGPSIEYVEGCV